MLLIDKPIWELEACKLLVLHLVLSCKIFAPHYDFGLRGSCVVKVCYKPAYSYL